MNQHPTNWYFPLLAVATVGSSLFFGWHTAQAQLVPDNTLGAENSVVVPVQPLLDEIQGGAVRGANLFHSFLEFNVELGSSVYFANPVGIEHILTRVTGDQASDIWGRLGVNGYANLWLINPNGINFGPDASLDVRGSFVASTADGIQLGQQGVFSATNPQNSQLLTIQPTALFHQAWAAHQAQINNEADLAVAPGQTLRLQGGTVKLTGSLTAPGGRVEVLGNRVGLLGDAEIDVSGVNGGGTALIGGDYQGQGEVPRASRTYISPNAKINADALTNGDGGRVIVWADEITRFYGEISARGGAESGDGGFVEVSGKEQLVFRGKVDTDSDTGNLGTLLLDPINIEIRSGNADGDDNGNDANAFGNNPAGNNGEVQAGDGVPTVLYETELEGQAANSNIILQATNDITIQNLADDELDLAGGPGSIEFIADADQDGAGDFRMEDRTDTIRTNGRAINISGANLILGNIDSSAYIAEGGAITLDASGDITVDSLRSFSYSFSYNDASGAGGAISLDAGGGIEITGDIQSFSYSYYLDAGVGGAITLDAGGNISTANPLFSSSLSTNGDAAAGGAITLDAGGDIETNELNSQSSSYNGDGGDGGAITLDTGGDIQAIDLKSNSRSVNGNARTGGTITLNAGGIISTEEITSNSRSIIGEAGDGGKIRIIADGNITTGELESSSEFDRGNTNPTLVGSGGDIEVVSRAGSISTENIRSTGNDDRGNITLDANSNDGITIRPTNNTPRPIIDASGTGDGGNITLINRTGDISLEDTEIISDTLLAGKGGEIRIEANSVNLTRTDITTAAVVGAVEEAGSISIQTEDLFLDATSLATSVEPAAGGIGGEIEILASGKVELRNAAFIDTATLSTGDAGDLTINAQSITLDNNSNIFSTTSAAGNAGNVTLTATNAISLTNRSNLSTAVDTGATGDGGQVSLTAESLSITGGSQIQALTRGNGNSGKVILDIAEGITISGIADGFASGVFTATQAANSGTGGNIEVATGNLLIAEGAVLSAQTASTNDGGNINIIADTVELRDGGQLLTNAFSSGNAGDIHLNASQQVLITGTNSNPGNAPPPVPRAIVTTRNQDSLAEVEPNDSLAEAMVLRDDLFSLSTADAAIPDISLSDRLPYVSLAATGSNPATSDYYSFEVVAGTRGFFDIDNGVNGDDPNDPGNVDLAISLFDSDGNLLKTSFGEGRASTLQGAGGSTDINDPYLQFTFRESGTYFLKITRDVDIDDVIDDTPNVRIPAPSTYTLQVSLGNPNFAGNVVNTSSASGLFAQTEGAGTAGDITINTPQLTIEDQGLVAATTAATGSAGTISIEATDSVILNQGSISTAVEQGAILPNTAVASNIEIDTKELNLTNGSNISTATAGIGDAGDVRIINSDRVFIDNSKVSSAVESSGVGTGGNIRFNTNDLSLANNATVSSATAGTGGAGEVEIHASDRISIDNSTVSSAVESSGIGAGGNILFNTNNLSLDNKGTVSSATAGMGNAGKVEIHASDHVSIHNSTISSAVESSGIGAGGNIRFNTNNFSVVNNATVSSATAGTGGAGEVEIHASDRISINNSTVSSAVESSGMGAGGNIRFNTNNFSVADNATVSSATAGTGDAGEVEIHASDGISINNSTVSSAVESFGIGTGGNILFNTNNLSLANNGTVSSATAGTGDAGGVEIHASDRISINNSTVSSAVESSGIGAGGNIRFNTDNFSVANNGTVSSATAGMGNAGEVEIHASDRISIDNNSTVSSAVNPTGVGTGGRINLQSPTVEVTNGARVSTSTEGQGTAGIIDVTANRFLATNGGQLLSTTPSNSNAGNIELNVIDDITLTGAGTGLFANSTPGSTGDGGSIIIDPITMTIEDGAGIAVDSQGAGIGGEIHISAGSLTLDQGFITAEAFSDQGGDINLDIADILLLRNHSLISATAGIGSGAGDGGNINIGAQFVIGVPNENSDIIANAFLGDGGRIEITTNAIFGLKFREEVTPSSDITASSEFGTDGIFIFNRLSFDATQGLNELPGVFVDAASLIGKDACALIDGKIGGGSSLIIIGKGGLPPNPGELLSNNNALVEWATHEPSNQRPAVVVSQQPTDSTGTPIYPEMRQAQGWIINPDGTVILTAEPQRVTPYNPGLRHPGCS